MQGLICALAGSLNLFFRSNDPEFKSL